MPRNNKITPDQEAEMTLLRSEGLTYDAIGARFGVTGEGVRFAVKRYEASRPDPVDSLRVTILKTLITEGDFPDSRVLMAHLGRDERWHHTGLHSLHHVLHALKRDGLVDMEEKSVGKNIDLNKIKITPKGAQSVQRKTNGARIEDAGRADHDALAAAGIPVAVIPRTDPTFDPNRPAHLQAIVDQAIADGIDPTGGEPERPYSVPTAVVPRPVPAELPNQTTVHPDGRPTSEPEFPILTQLLAKREAGRVARVNADKLIEAAILVESFDPEATVILQARADALVEDYALSSVEAEYVFFAEWCRGL